MKPKTVHFYWLKKKIQYISVGFVYKFGKGMFFLTVFMIEPTDKQITFKRNRYTRKHFLNRNNNNLK